MEKRSIKKSIAIIMVAVICISALLCLTACEQPSCQRASDTEYVVLQISDVHMSNKGIYPYRVFHTIRQLVKMSNPDFIIVTGDVTGEDDNKLAFETFGEFMETLNLPWTFTYGNHDAQGSTFNKEDIANYLESLPNCKFTKGDEDVYGFGNNYFNITDKNGKVIHTLFTLDMSKPTSGTHKIEDSQIEWYTNAVKSIAKEVNGDETKVVTSSIYGHIPMREMAPIYAEAVANGTVVYGSKGEEECPDAEEDMLYETMVELGSTKYYYCGHEHLSNYVIEKDGMRMTYTETCDHKLYVPTLGGMVINIKSDGSIAQQNLARKKFSCTYTLTEEY